MSIPLLFLYEDIRLSILHYLIESYNRYANSEKCRNFSFIESVAKVFNMQERLGDAAYLDENVAQKIMLKEKYEVIRFSQCLIGYLLSNDKWTLDKSGYIDDDPNAYINNILGKLSYISRELHNPCDDFQIKNINSNRNSFHVENISPKKEEGIKTKNDVTAVAVEETIYNPKVENVIDNEIFYKDL